MPPVSITMRADHIAWIGPAISTISPRTPTTRPQTFYAVDIAFCSASAFIAKALSFRGCGLALNFVFTRTLIITSLSLVTESALKNEVES